MKVLCLTDFPMHPPGYRWIWEHVSGHSDEVDFLWAEPPDRSAGWGKLLTRHPSYFRLAWQSMRRITRAPYDLIAAWESKVGMPVALLRRLARRYHPPLVILAFVPGSASPRFDPLIRFGLKAANHVVVATSAERAAYQHQFQLQASKVSVCPIGTYDLLETARQQSAGNPYAEPYVHASGRSARDYATLVAAVDGLDVKVVIHGRGYNFKGIHLPPNVEVGEMVPRDQYLQLVKHSLFQVVPLKPLLHPVGGSQILMAMMMGKAVIATRLLGLEEMVEDGVTGRLVEPGNVDDMRSAISYLLDHRDEMLQMGLKARQRFEELYDFPVMARRTHNILRQVHVRNQGFDAS